MRRNKLQDETTLSHKHGKDPPGSGGHRDEMDLVTMEQVAVEGLSVQMETSYLAIIEGATR